MTIENIKFVEAIIESALEAYDTALKNNDTKVQEQAIEIINYELAKLDQNEVVLRTLPN